MNNLDKVVKSNKAAITVQMSIELPDGVSVQDLDYDDILDILNNVTLSDIHDFWEETDVDQL